MQISTNLQGSMEWLKERAGFITGSNAKLIMAEGRNGQESEMKKKYRIKLAAERLLNKSLDVDISNIPHVSRGTEQEKYARLAFECKTQLIVEEVGFITSEKYEWVGGSIDGFVNNRQGIVEIKCPNPETHLKYILGDKVPCEHKYQMIHNGWLPGAYHAFFVSYCEDFKDVGLDLFIKEMDVNPNSAEICAYEQNIITFSQSVKDTVESLRDSIKRKWLIK